MADLRSIRLSILELPYDEQVQLHLRIRESRKTPKKPQTKAKAKRITEKKSFQKAVNSLSKEELARLIKKLEKQI